MSHFNQPNKERTNIVWTTKYKKLLEMCIVQYVAMKCVFISKILTQLISTTVKSAKPSTTFWIFLLRTKNRQSYCLAVIVHVVLQERRVATSKKSHLHFWWNFSANHNPAHPNVNQKSRSYSTYGIVMLTLHCLTQLNKTSIFKSFCSSSVHCEPVKFIQPTVNLRKTMIFSVSNDGIQWTLDFGPDSVTDTVIDFVQNITISSQETPPAAWQLLWSQRQDISDNHPPPVSITQNQEGTMEMRDEVLSSVGAQDLFTSSY